MQLELSQEDQDFRAEMREAFTTTVPQEIRDTVKDGIELSADQIRDSMRALNAEGLAVPHWPTEYGGRDWTELQRHIWHEEMQRACVPRPLAFNANMIGPVLAQFGTTEQKDEFLPRTANLDIWWSQGFSEPDAGSDLAGLRCTAVKDGEEWVVNGQKTWTTLGQYGDWIFTLVRTDPDVKKQAGISMLLIDMTSEGLEVRPIELIDGGHEVNEVWFTDVRVPAANLVGDLNGGWTIAKFLLGNERVGVAPVGEVKRRLALVKEQSKDRIEADPLTAARIAELENELLALELTALRVVAHSHDGEPHPASSVLKLKGTELQQAVSELVVDLAGPGGLASGADEKSGLDGWARRSTPTYLNLRKASIYGGSNEIQRQIISRGILGLWVGRGKGAPDMDFEYDDEQDALRDAVRGLAGKAYGDYEKRRQAVKDDPGFDEKQWARMAEMGLLGLPFAEDDGGVGAGPVEIGIVCQELGRVIAPEPFLTSVVLAGGLVQAVGSSEQRQELLGGLAGGETLLAFAHAEPGRGWTDEAADVTASQDGNGWTLTGVKDPVPTGARADVLVVSAALPDGGTGLFVVDGDAPERTGYPTYDGTRAARVALDGTAATPLGEPGRDVAASIAAVHDITRVMAGNQALGGMESLLTATTGYLKSRKQFGVTLSTFQALTFRAADMYVSLELTHSLVDWATMMVEQAGRAGDPARLADAARRVTLQVSRGGRHVGQEAIQLHGGIAMTAEYSVGNVVAHLTWLDHLLGDGHHQLGQLAGAVTSYADLDPLGHAG